VLLFYLDICSASLLPVLQQCFSSTWTLAVLHLYLDFPEYNMATAASGAATASLDQQSTRDSYIPIFDGTLAGYKEWRKRITIYAKKMELTNRKNECVLNLLGSLQGTAWKLVEDFDLEKAKEETAFKDILSLLDSAFQYDSKVELPADCRAACGLLLLLRSFWSQERPDLAAVYH